MGLLAAIRFGRLAPMQASSLARLPTLLASWAGRAFPGTRHRPLTFRRRARIPCGIEGLARVTLGHDCDGSKLRAFATHDRTPLFRVGCDRAV
jgi:hypothetical protein